METNNEKKSKGGAIGAVIGTIVLAMFLPIFNLGSLAS